jgi:hypothetical protein
LYVENLENKSPQNKEATTPFKGNTKAEYQQSQHPYSADFYKSIDLNQA